MEDAGKGITNDALAAAVEAIEGFPYMLQLVGFRAWSECPDERDVIDAGTVKRGIALAQKDFEMRVIRATVNELSDVDMDFLVAMLSDADVSRVADLEKRMGKSSGYISRYRGRLIAEGVIEPAGRGKVRFALPGLRAYLEEATGAK